MSTEPEEVTVIGRCVSAVNMMDTVNDVYHHVSYTCGTEGHTVFDRFYFGVSL